MWLNMYSIEHADVTGNDKLGRKRKKAKKMYEEALKEGRVLSLLPSVASVHLFPSSERPSQKKIFVLVS